MAGIMGKDAYIKVCKKAEVLEKELEYEKARNKTLIKEVTADCETIKARDAKIDELKLEVEKWKSKLDLTVKMYEEDAYLVDQARKKDAKELDELSAKLASLEEESYKYDQAQDYIFELETIKDFFKNESHKMKESIKKYEKDREDSAMEISKLQNEINELHSILSDASKMTDIYRNEVRKLNSACAAKNVKLDKSYRRNVVLRRLLTIIENQFHLCVEEFPEFYLIHNSEKPFRINKDLLMNINMEDDHE